MLAAGAGALLPAGAGTLCSILLEVCSGCDLAARTGRWGSLLCCAALSVQGLSVLLQVRTICPPEMPLRPLYRARLLHLPLSLALFYLLLPGGEADVFSTFDAAGAAGLCPARFCSVLYGSLRFAQWNPSS